MSVTVLLLNVTITQLCVTCRNDWYSRHPIPKFVSMSPCQKVVKDELSLNAITKDTILGSRMLEVTSFHFVGIGVGRRFIAI